MGVDAQGFPGGLLRLDPAFAMSSLLPHDLCHGWSASRRPPTDILLSRDWHGYRERSRLARGTLPLELLLEVESGQ